MASYSASIDLTEPGQGNKVSMPVGTGGVTAGDCVKLSGGAVVYTTSRNDVVYGIARDTVSAGGHVVVLRTGCRVRTPNTLTADGYCQPTHGGTGELSDYGTGGNGTKVGIVEVSATSASIIRVL